jgi:hypothetical protein
MKHLLFAIGLVATLASCSKKEEPAPEPMPTLIGRWKLINYSEYNVPNNNWQAPYHTLVWLDTINARHVTFTEDGRLIDDHGQGYVYTYPYTLAGNTYTYSVTDVNGHILYQSWTIEVLTTRKLVLNRKTGPSPLFISTDATETYTRRE